MTKQSKRHIAVSPRLRAELDEAKEIYEAFEGPTNWDDFLKITTGLGLAELDIYILTRSCQRNKTIWDVKCPVCTSWFAIYSEVPPLVMLVPCPSCGANLLIDCRTSSAEIQKSGDGDQ